MSLSWDTITSAIVTLVTVSVGFFITQIAHAYLWDGKNENGTSKSPWAPSPSNLPFYWNGYKAFRLHSYLALTDWSKQLQTSIYTVKLIQKRVIVLSHADVVRKALVELEQSNSSRSITTDAIETVMGDQGKTVFTAQFSAYWGRLRRAINRVMRHVVVEDKGLSTLVQEEGKVDPELLRERINRMAMEAVIEMVMGKQSEMPAEWVDALMQVCKETEQLQSSRFYYRYGALVPIIRTLGVVLGGHQPVVQLRNSALDILLRMQQGNVPESLKHVEPSKNDPTPEPIAPDEILTNSLHLIMHGYRFLASSLFTLLQRLASQSYDIQAHVAASPAFATSFVAETMRYTPPMRLYTHTARSDHDLVWNGKSYRVDEGTPLVVNLDMIHFDPQYYSNPYKFDPERFLVTTSETTTTTKGVLSLPSILDDRGDNDEEGAKKNKKQEKSSVRDHLAFGVGRRACLGSRASQRVMVAMLSQIVKKYKLRGGDPDSVVDHASGIWSWTGRTDTKGATIEFIRRGV